MADKYDVSLLMNGVEIWREWTTTEGTYTRYAKEFGPHIGWLYAEVTLLYERETFLDFNKMKPIPKRLRCNNSKRFKKLLMSIGYPPRVAGWTVSFVQASQRVLTNRKYRDGKHSYAQHYQQQWLRTYFGYYGKTRKDFGEPIWEWRDNLEGEKDKDEIH